MYFIQKRLKYGTSVDFFQWSVGFHSNYCKSRFTESWGFISRCLYYHHALITKHVTCMFYFWPHIERTL